MLTSHAKWRYCGSIPYPSRICSIPYPSRIFQPQFIFDVKSFFRCNSIPTTQLLSVMVLAAAPPSHLSPPTPNPNPNPTPVCIFLGYTVLIHGQCLIHQPLFAQETSGKHLKALPDRVIELKWSHCPFSYASKYLMVCIVGGVIS